MRDIALVIECSGCERCDFKRLDSLSSYPLCGFPTDHNELPDSMELVEAMKLNAAPKNCPIREGAAFFLKEGS